MTCCLSVYTQDKRLFLSQSRPDPGPSWLRSRPESPDRVTSRRLGTIIGSEPFRETYQLGRYIYLSQDPYMKFTDNGDPSVVIITVPCTETKTTDYLLDVTGSSGAFRDSFLIGKVLTTFRVRILRPFRHSNSRFFPSLLNSNILSLFVTGRYSSVVLDKNTRGSVLVITQVCLDGF